MLKRIFVFYFFSVFFNHSGHAIQNTDKFNNETDSILNLLRASADTSYIKNCCELATAYINEKKTSLSFNYLDSALLRAQKIKNKRLEGYVYNCLGNMYNYLGEVKKAIESFEKSLVIYQRIKHLAGECSVYLNKGNTYFNSGEYEKAEKSYRKSLSIYLLHPNDDKTEADIYNNIGSACGAEEKYAEAKEFFFKAVVINKKNKDYISISYGYNNIGSVFDAMGDNKQAIYYFKEALTLKLKYGNNPDKADAYRHLGQSYKTKENYKQAVECYQQSLNYTDTGVYNNGLIQLYTNLAEIYETSNNIKDAMHFYKLVKYVSGIQFKRELSEQIEQNDRMVDFVKVHLTDSIAQAGRITNQQLEIKRSNTIRYFLVLIVAIAFVFFALLYKRYKITQSQKKEIHLQKELVDEKQKEIVDSINYAKRLQDAILPPAKLIEQYLPESFIFYKPKDIVAGDFYWFQNIANGYLLAAADCTGHGVPGALVSVVCSNALNRAVKEFKLTEPGQILDKTRELVLETFSKSEQEVKDGMDISLAYLNPKTYQLSWSGANNPLWYINQGNMLQITANKQSVGMGDQQIPFKTHHVQLEKGDMIYLFTDGFADQFGGENGKKFKYRPMKDILLSISTKPLSKQKELLENEFEKWKGRLEQVDDVCVIGIKI